MVDDTARKQSEASARIDLGQDREVEYWAKALGLTELDLRLIIRVTGPVVEDVKAFLKW
ncbi:MAG: DUF3606 domain-containing protein [Planctomycetota bacterium]|jgi:hypothetical protein